MSAYVLTGNYTVNIPHCTIILLPWNLISASLPLSSCHKKSTNAYM